MSEKNVHVIISNEKKDPVVGLLLAFFFGCIGMLYSTPKGALIMLAPTIISALLCFIVIGFPMLFICNVMACYWSYKACVDHNEKIEAQMNHVIKSKAA